MIGHSCPRPSRWIAASFSALIALSPRGGAAATTLADAIAEAYRTNPALQIQRSQLRALDEEYVQAYAAYRPTLSLGATGQYAHQRVQPAPGEPVVGLDTNTLTAGVSATQILYNGGRTAAQVSTAEADILSGREQLRLAEGATMLSVVTAYAAVERDQEIFAARRLAVGAYQAQVDEIQARFAAGAVTRTDVEQAQSQLASARSDLANAQGALEASRAAYVAAVGENPGQLEPPPPLPGVPTEIGEAFSIASDNSPQVLTAMFDERAAREHIREEKAQDRPTVGAQAFYGFQGGAVPFESRNYYTNTGVQVNVTIPLFTGGLNASNIRQAQEQDVSKQLQVDNVRRSVIQMVATSWNGISAADRALLSDQAALVHAEGSARGMKIEYRGGLRSTLEVLNEEERLETARVAVATDAYDDYTARANLLNAMGRLQAIDFTAGAVLYDPARNLRRVKAIGATPLDGLFAAVDHVGEPSDRPARRTDIAVSPTPVSILPAPSVPAAPPPFATVSPTPRPYQPSAAPELRGPL